MKKLTKAIEDSKKEKERLEEEKNNLQGKFKDIEVKAFAVQENYKETEKVNGLLVHFHTSLSSFLKNSIHFVLQLIHLQEEVCDTSKANYNKVKKTMDELKGSEVPPYEPITVFFICITVD